MLIGFCLIFLFLALGKLLEFGFNLPIPGSILGMLLLIGSQFIWPRLHSHIKAVAGLFQRYLALIYFPLGVVIVLDYRALFADWLVVVLVITVATAFSVILTAWVSRGLFRLSETEQGDKKAKDYIDNGLW